MDISKLSTCNGFVSFAGVNGHTATQINVGKYNKLSSISVFKRNRGEFFIF